MLKEEAKKTQKSPDRVNIDGSIDQLNFIGLEKLNS